MKRPHLLTFSARLFAICLLIPAAAALRAEIGDVLLQTDHPQYPGEGALQTPEDCVAWATRNIEDDQQRALAIFKWLLTHQWHLMSPQEWCQPGRQPGAKSDDYEMVVYDANRGRFSYGYGLCGTVHAWNEAYWRAAGFPSRRRAFPGHSNSEAFVDGQWRMYDTDMAGVVLKQDGSVAGYDDIIADLSLLDAPSNGLPRYPFAWPSDFNTMRAGWKEVASGGHWYSLYHGGYAAHPPVVHLRSGETLTRYAHPDAFGDESKRRFWHQQQGGPQRLWTFANSDVPFHNEDDSNCRGRTRYGNAVFEYKPNLTSDRCREGIVDSGRNLNITDDGLSSSDGQTAFVVFEHFSPYVICGDPVDDEDPMNGPATHGLVIDGLATGHVTVGVSPDQGQTWHVAGACNGEFQFDLTDHVKGHYGWWLKFQIAPMAVLKEVRISTTGQLCETIYPRLKPNGTTVTWSAGHQSVVPVLPLLTDESQTTNRYERRDLRSDNLEFVGRSADERLAYRVRGPQSASVVFRIPSLTPLLGVNAAARFAVRSPTPKGAEYAIDVSTDDGTSWHEFAAVVPPQDNEYSSGWVYGTTELYPTLADDVLVRVRLDGGGYGTGLLTAELYGLRSIRPTSAARVAWSWYEGDEHREHSFDVPAGTSTATSFIPTGDSVRDDFVRVSVP